MKITKIQLKNFKFFSDITIDNIPPEAEIVLLVGPNGTGKSCIFDAFNYSSFISKHINGHIDDEYYRKDKSTPFSVSIFDKDNNQIQPREFQAKNIKFYGRSSYRFTNKITRNSISTEAAKIVLTDQDSPRTYADLDQRIENDVEKALGELLQAVQAQKGKTDKEIVDQVNGQINESLKYIFPDSNLQLKRIIDPHSDYKSANIDLEFSKNNSIFSFRNLSSGEKEIVDIIFNFHRRKNAWINDGIYFIDEPELHLNTKIQASLLKELHRLCREADAQLWVATHSLGFLRAAQEQKHKEQNSVAIFEFTEELAGNQVSLSPIKGNRKDWKRIFQTALEDLTGLITPKKIIYCEGRKDPDEDGNEAGIDAKVYNQIFTEKESDSLFISSGGNTEPDKYSAIALQILKKAIIDAHIWLLKDKDIHSDGTETTDEERQNFIDENPSMNRMLKRKEIENYLFDYEIVSAAYKFVTKEEYTKIISDIKNQDVKKIIGKLMELCEIKTQINKDEFKLKLSEHILPSTNIYKELYECIFNTQKIEIENRTDKDTPL